MGGKGRTKNWFWIQVKIRHFLKVTQAKNKFNKYRFYSENLKFIISHFIKRIKKE